MKRIYFLLPPVFLFAVGCTKNVTSSLSSVPTKPALDQRPKVQYYIDEDSDGIFEKIEVTEEPVLQPSKEAFNKNFYGSLKYPAIARERGIEGIVILDVLIDENGFVHQVNIKQSVSKELDEAARNAFLNATSNGYAPLKWKSTYVKYRMDIPVGFYLQ